MLAYLYYEKHIPNSELWYIDYICNVNYDFIIKKVKWVSFY